MFIFTSFLSGYRFVSSASQLLCFLMILDRLLDEGRAQFHPLWELDA